MSHGEPTTEGTNMDDHGETGTESPGTEVTSMMLMQMLMEQQRLAREQQAAQQEVLVRLVEQQWEEGPGTGRRCRVSGRMRRRLRRG